MNKRCYRNPVIVFRKEGKTGLLYDSLTGRIETLNETGVFIWGLCNGKNSADDIVGKVLKKYAGNRAIIKKEAGTFLRKIVREKYIEVKI